MDVLVVVVPALGQRVAGARDPADVVRVRREVRLEGGVLLQQTLGVGFNSSVKYFSL